LALLNQTVAYLHHCCLTNSLRTFNKININIYEQTKQSKMTDSLQIVDSQLLLPHHLSHGIHDQAETLALQLFHFLLQLSVEDLPHWQCLTMLHLAFKTQIPLCEFEK
jgi:hypothetical protein